MAWVVTYQEESKDQEITDHEVKKGYMYASEISTLNGFVANQFDAKTQEAVVKGLLQDCYQSFGIDPKAPGFDLEQPHPKLPELNKFWYMKKLLSSTDRTISETKMGLQMDMQSQGLGKALDASSGAPSVVKVENQPYLDLKQEITVVQSMKTSLEKEHHKARLLYSFSNVCRDFTICFPQNILDQGDIQMRDLKFLFAFGFHVILTCSLWAV